jgi:uncharacterized protein (TIGR02687 family)
MLKEKVEQYFERYNDLRILFFFDEGLEYEKNVEELNPNGIQVLKYADNPFRLKVLFAEADPSERFVLYCPFAYPSNQEDYHRFPLLGLVVANKTLELDNVGEFMDRYGLQRHQKSLVSKYMSELKYAGVQKICEPILRPGKLDEHKLQQGLVSSFLKLGEIQPWTLIAARLMLLTKTGDHKEFDRVARKIISLGMEDDIVERISNNLGLNLKELALKNVHELAVRIHYNLLTLNIDEASKDDPYSTLKVTERRDITSVLQFYSDVERSKFAANFEALRESFKDEIRGEKLVAVYGAELRFEEYTSSMVFAIIREMLPSLDSDPKKVYERLEEIGLSEKIEPSVRSFMNYLVAVAKAIIEINAHSDYELNTPDEYIAKYTKGGYRVDFNYRKAVFIFKKLVLADLPEDINPEGIQAKLNDAYEKHIDKLNRSWIKCLSENEFDYAALQVPKQYDFYEKEVKGLDQKVAVIISDALRYEAAQEFLSELHGDPQNTAEMRHMLASIPSKTNVGMAQLLPGAKSFKTSEVKVDGNKIAGIEQRNQILKSYSENSVAIGYPELESLTRDEKREIFKNDVVYVYHDVIDSIGDKRVSEHRSFDAVSEAIAELKRLVKTLHATLNVAKVFITSDHGFLYNERKIEDKDKEEMPAKDSIQAHNRFFLSKDKQEMELGFSFPLEKTTKFESDVWVNIPFSVNRYRRQGVGHQFVHGGGSLQELVVPLIESSRKREEVSKKVSPLLIDTVRMRVVSNILKVSILQESPVSRFEKERVVTIGLYNEQELVSNLEKVELNFTSESPTERMVRKEIILEAAAAGHSFLKLKIYDIDDKLNPLIEERVQNNTLIETDF